MTKESQNRTIAEACGWFLIEDRSEGLMMPAGNFVVGYPPQGGVVGKKVPLPDYLDDLNSMHKAERCLPVQEVGIVDQYSSMLWEIVERDVIESGDLSTADKYTWHATASQRAESFLKTIGKWTNHET